MDINDINGIYKLVTEDLGLGPKAMKHHQVPNVGTKEGGVSSPNINPGNTTLTPAEDEENVGDAYDTLISALKTVKYQATKEGSNNKYRDQLIAIAKEVDKLLDIFDGGDGVDQVTAEVSKG